MLFETITYPYDFPINIIMAEVTEYPIHYHRDIEFIYVLSGEVRLKNVCHNYILKEGDLFTNSGNEIHGLNAGSNKNVIAIIHISNRFFTQYFPDLPKSCFMTYSKNDRSPHMQELRRMILNILLDYSKKGFNYKSNCVNQMLNIIEFLNAHFNLFSFKGSDVVNFRNNNPVVVERISRITNYIYANHSRNITLDELAKIEHLSTFYLSHFIREHIRLSFQEFLSFARVEMSEIPLLETEKKISVIARESGFSTTSYYEKFFSKWFGHTPAEYRSIYSPRILSESRPTKYQLLPDNVSINLIRRHMSAAIDQEKSASRISNLSLSVKIDPGIGPLTQIQKSLDILITQDDYKLLDERLFSLLHELNATRVTLIAHRDDNEASVSLLVNRLNFIGYDVHIEHDYKQASDSSYGYDSIAASINILKAHLSSGDTFLRCELRDQGNISEVLKGNLSCMTSSLIFKPSYHAYRLLKNISGNLICSGKYYYVIKSIANKKDSYTIVIMNYNDEIENLCARSTGIYETNEIINSFRDELNVDFSIPVDAGEYVIAKFALSADNSILTYMSHLKFAKTFPLPESWIHLLNTEPLSQLQTETVSEEINISSTIKGAGIHVILVERCMDTDPAL